MKIPGINKKTLVIAAIVVFIAVLSTILSQIVFAASTPVAPIKVANDYSAPVSRTSAVQEPAKYNLSTISGSTTLYVKTGAEINPQISFYNVDGNRTTNVQLVIDEAPDGWTVDVGSPFQVEPGLLSAEPVNEVSKGMRNARIGNRGYTLATVAGIVISAPATTISGNYTVKVTIVADWKGQTGQVSISQNRDFVYTIVVS